MGIDNAKHAGRRLGSALPGRFRATMIFTALAFAACSGGDSPEDEFAVAFSAKGEAATRAAITTELRKIGVFGYSHTGDFDDDPGARVPDFFLNQAVADLPGNGTWTYTGVRKYWPRDGRYLSFFAYAPFIDVENTFALYPATVTDKGAPTITYTVPAKILDQTDLIYGNNTDLTYFLSDNGKVELPMYHALTRVDFVVKLAAAEKGRPFIVQFNELTVRNVAGRGTLDLSKSAFDPVAEPWTTVRPFDDSGWASYTMTPGGHGGLANLVFDARETDPDTDEGEIDAWNWNRLFIKGQYLMLIPQELGDTPDDLTPAEISLKYTFTNVYTGEVSDVEEVIPLARPALPAWLPGVGITYQLTVSLLEGTDIEFDIGEFISPTPWESQNGGNPITGGVG